MKITPSVKLPVNLEREVANVQQVNSPQISLDVGQTVNMKTQDTTMPPGEEELIKLVEKSNKMLQDLKTRLEFSIHEKTHQIMVKVRNTQTDEVVREIPPEKLVDIIYNIQELAGLFKDERI